MKRHPNICCRLELQSGHERDVVRFTTELIWRTLSPAMAKDHFAHRGRINKNLECEKPCPIFAIKNRHPHLLTDQNSRKECNKFLRRLRIILLPSTTSNYLFLSLLSRFYYLFHPRPFFYLVQLVIIYFLNKKKDFKEL